MFLEELGIEFKDQSRRHWFIQTACKGDTVHQCERNLNWTVMPSEMGQTITAILSRCFARVKCDPESTRNNAFEELGTYVLRMKGAGC